jgi:uncharacterized protein
MNDRISAVLLHAIQTRLNELLNFVPAVQGVFLATDDGFEVAQAIAGKDLDPARMAAMCSSMVALSHALVLESDLAETESLLIEAARGKIVLLSVATVPKLSLSVVAKPGATLGQVLVSAKQCSAQIVKLMAQANGSPAP